MCSWRSTPFRANSLSASFDGEGRSRSTRKFVSTKTCFIEATHLTGLRRGNARQHLARRNTLLLVKRGDVERAVGVLHDDAFVRVEEKSIWTPGTKHPLFQLIDRRGVDASGRFDDELGA
jgi:hypothetical protein